MPRNRVCLFTLVLAFLSAGLCSAAASTVGNLLSNGSFDDGKAHWSLHTEQGAKATFEVKSVRRQRGVPPGGDQRLRPQQPRAVGLQLRAGRPRTGQDLSLEFRCKSSLPRNTRVVLIEQLKPWGNAGVAREFPMTNQWQTRHSCFRAKAVPCPNLKVDFFLGEASSEVWIDDVAIVPVDIDQLTAQRKAAGNIQITAQTSTFHLNDRGVLTGLRDPRAKHNLIFPLDVPAAFRLSLRRGQEVVERMSDEAADITHERDGQGSPSPQPSPT